MQLRQGIADAALKHRLPAMTNARQFARAGLLMSYGPIQMISTAGRDLRR